MHVSRTAVWFMGLFLTWPALAGTISGNARFQKIAGNPGAGYAELYETDLFLSPPDNSLLGPSRRLGAPPGQPARGDGYYSIDSLPSGNYSILVDQPDFFVVPKVVRNVGVVSNQSRTLNIDLDVDYSTYITGDQQWTPWQWDWTQTFHATGTSVTGLSFRLAGTTDGKPATISFREDNGDPNPEHWRLVATRQKNGVGSNTDNWLRFRSGEIPLTPGKNYAVQVHVDGGFAPYKRNKDSISYAQGRGYDENGNPTNYDLNYTVFVDKPTTGTLVTINKRDNDPKLGTLDPNGFATRWGQTFKAQGTSLAAADVFAAGGSTWDLPFTWTVRAGGPAGQLIGPTKHTAAAYFTPQVGLHGVSYNPGEVPLTPGQTYYIEFSNASGFNPYLMPAADAYPGGLAYQAGTARSANDLAMMLMEYPGVPEPGGMLGMSLLLISIGRRRRARRDRLGHWPERRADPRRPGGAADLHPVRPLGGGADAALPRAGVVGRREPDLAAGDAARRRTVTS
ncbi:MAG TPA: carboxypeptidase-like regulatory domain-containing protein [Tepidisphaeraceae bacterium]